MFLVNSRLGLFTAPPDTEVAGGILLPKLRIHFAEFLSHESLAHLRILSSPTCVGLRYGHHPINYDAFLGSRITLTIPSAEASGYCRPSALTGHGFACAPAYSLQRLFVAARRCHFCVTP